MWQDLYKKIHKKAYNYTVIREKPSVWIEKNIILPEGVSKIKGKFSFDVSPYTREVVDLLYSGDGSRFIAIMKCAQIGFTQGVIVPGMAYKIAEDPAPMLFMAADKGMAMKSIEERLDPIIYASGLSDLLKPSVQRRRGQRTGDTSASKEYAGGRLSVVGTSNPNELRQISVETIFADDWDSAPRADSTEGSTRKLMEGRQTSYASTAKTFYISTPTVNGASNIEEVYLLGDQKKWHWECPSCKEYIPLEWNVKNEDGTFAGIVYKLDDKHKLIKGSVKYKCQCCGHLIDEKHKYKLNKKGKWIATAEAINELYTSYQINAIAIPPGFTSWIDLVQEFLDACPPGKPVRQDLLKTFVNIRLGQTWKEEGEVIEVMDLMNNRRNYFPGTIPDNIIESDQNGRIILITLSADLNGVMDNKVEDVRLDWEIVAHTSKGQTYSIDQGSIGTFKRNREMTAKDRINEHNRERWTASHGKENSIWDKLTEIITKEYLCESGELKTIDISVIDTGFATKACMKYITKMSETGLLVYGVKGKSEAEFRQVTKDTPMISRSRESQLLYLVEGNQTKDLLSYNMKLIDSDMELSADGMMYFPVSSDGKYSLKDYFKHFEAETRKEVIKNGEIVGYSWQKVSDSSINHFFDVKVYAISAREIYIDLLRKTDKTVPNLTWDEYRNLFN